MSEIKDLVPLKDYQIEKIFKDPEICKKLLNDIKEIALGVTFDVTNAKGRGACITHAANVRRSIKAVDEKGLALTKGMRDEIDQINGIRRTVREFLEPIAKEVRLPVTNWEEEQKEKEEAEKTRIADIQEKIKEIQLYFSETESADTDKLLIAVEELKSKEITKEIYEEFLENAEEAKNKRLKELHLLLKFQQDQDKLEAEKKEFEEKQKMLREKEEEIRKKAEEQEERRLQDLAARLNRISDFLLPPATSAERIKMNIDSLEKMDINSSFQEQESTARRLKEDILQKLKLNLKEAEVIAENKIKKAEQEKEKKEADRKADIEHRRKINRKILIFFMSMNLSKSQAVLLLRAIINSEDKLLTVNY